MEDIIFNDLHNLKSEQEAAENAAESAGYTNYRVGKIVEAHADCLQAGVHLSVLSISKSEKSGRKADTEYIVKHVTVIMSCATRSEAFAALGGIKRGYYAVYDDDNELVAVLSGSFDD